MGEHAREGLRIVVQGGAGAPQTLRGGCETAVARALEAYRDGGTALDAVVAAVVTLEDDGRFNAGSGSILRLDGETVEMDAAVMDSTGVLGAVAAVASVSNPVLAARRVAETPHVMLASYVYQRIAERATPHGACEAGIALFADDVPVGIIAVGGSGQGVASNGSMAWAGTPAGD